MRRERDDLPPLERLIAIGCTDLTARAQAGQLGRAYQREAELDQMARALLDKRSVLLHGPAEVGKTALIHELVCRMHHKQGPEHLHGRRVVAISTGGILAGTAYLGEWQTRLTDLLEAVKQAGNIYLYIEDIWGIRDAGRVSDKADGFATLIRPYLERQDVALIGETTPENFASGPHRLRGLADELSLMKCFDLIKVEETPPETTRRILVEVSRHLQRAHQVRVEPPAIERCMELTRRFLPYRAFPGKAVRLLEETARTHGPGEPARASARALNGTVIVDADLVSTGFSHMTGLPEKIISDRIPLTQEEIRAYFEERVIGQEEAISAIASVVTLVKAELHDLNRPLGVLFFVGPTGVGKTELAKTLAEYLFGSKDKLIRFDMSEFKTFPSMDDLLEQVTEKQRRQSFSVLLLDEFEKAGPWVFDLFLSAFDDARLTDSSGRSVDLHNTIVIMTSNLGSEVQPARPAPALGFVHAQEEAVDTVAARRASFIGAVHATFRPEFVNRLDKIVVFQPLGLDEMRRIARRELGKALILPGRLGVTRRNILLDFREEVLDVLLREGFSPVYGARPLQRAIKELVLLPLAQKIAAQPAMGDQLLELGVREGQIVAEVIPVGPTLTAVRPEPADGEPAERGGERVPGDGAAEQRDRRKVGRERAPDLHTLEDAIEELRQRVEWHIESEQYRALQNRARALLDHMGEPNFWDDKLRMRQTLAAAHRLKLVEERFTGLQSRAEGLCEKARMIRVHGDSAGLRELAGNREALERDIALAELELLAGEEAGSAQDGACLRITPLTLPHAADAREWAETLAGMYAAWAERKGYEVERLHEDGAAPLLLLRGVNVARILLGEQGIHKLHAEPAADPRGAGRSRRVAEVRLARVEVLPLPPDAEADPEAGGGADQVTHTGGTPRLEAEPTDEVTAALLAARAARPVRGSALAADETVARVYYLARTQHVRDPRTGHREGRPVEVLRGAIDGFLFAFLKSEQERAAQAAAAAAAKSSEAGAQAGTQAGAPTRKPQRARRAADPATAAPTAPATRAMRAPRAARPG